LKVTLRRSIYFTSPYQITVQEEVVPDPLPGQVVVQTLCSAISPGTEGLIYRGRLPQEVSLDENLPALAGGFAYPLKYGYSAVGRVIEVGDGGDRAWQDRLVFAFHPHESCFTAAPDELQVVPDDVSPEDAVFLPNMETAVNLVMDGRPLIGEQVVVFGQGIVGLLTTALLSWFPLQKRVTLDRFALRRQASLELGAHASLDPDEPGALEKLRSLLPAGADLAYELSGAPAALDAAIAVTGFAGRVIIGSWYGQKRASLDLGGAFHRSRIQLISSQVSTLAPELSGRWSKERRFAVAWEALRKLQPSRFITHTFPVQDAAQAYRLLDQRPETAIQILIEYP
jgi:2-desacetyl-2-hydroxyethyl bacteriochlorophyllide A dehydrogenase